MKPRNLSPYLSHFWSVLPDALVTKSALEILQGAALHFPGIPRIGLECRMDEDPRVDLQQCLIRSKDSLPSIRAWLEAQQSMDRADWQDFANFLGEWCQEGSFLHQQIPELFLELDLIPGNIRTPLLFLAISPEIQQESLELIIERVLGQRHQGLTSCLQMLPQTACIHYLGIAFSRKKNILRIVIKGLKFQEIFPTLRNMGRNIEHLEEDVWQAYHLADRVNLTLDIGETLLPTFGLECFWEDQPRLDSRWKFVLQDAVRKGICLPKKAEEVLQWEQDYFPTKGKSWPPVFWLESLQRPDKDFTHLKRKISHLKFSFGTSTSLKAYLGYGHLWYRAEIEKTKPPSRSSTPNEAMDRAIQFLLKTQKSSGAWVDFLLPPGKSDEWITAYVAYYLSFFSHRDIEQALSSAANFLTRRFIPGKGWGHHQGCTRDADSSIWAMMFLQKVKKAQELSFLNRYKTPSGGVRTYVDEDGEMQRMTGLAEGEHFDGWKEIHPCVTVAYALFGDKAAKNFVLVHQMADGSVPSYWWKTPAYATAIASEALQPKDIQEQLFLEAAGEWAEEQYLASKGNPFDLSNLLIILLRSNKNSALREKITNDLLELQNPDGSFEGSACLRIPKPMNKELSDVDSIYQDKHRTFTTITVLKALRIAQSGT